MNKFLVTCAKHMNTNRHQQFEGSSSIQRQGQTKRSDSTKGFESIWVASSIMWFMKRRLKRHKEQVFLN